MDVTHEDRIRALGKIRPHHYETPKHGSANLPCLKCGLRIEAPEHKVKKATDLEPIPVEDAGNYSRVCRACGGPGKVDGKVCKSCAGSGKERTLYRATDSAHRARLHRALDAVMDSVK